GGRAGALLWSTKSDPVVHNLFERGRPKGPHTRAPKTHSINALPVRPNGKSSFPLQTDSCAASRSSASLISRMKVALVHDWLTGMRGGERCLEVLCELFPDADLYTLVHDPGKVSPAIERRRIRTSFINRLPRAKEYYRYYLPLIPSAIDRFDFSPYDLIISSSHCVAKGAKRPVGA